MIGVTVNNATYFFATFAKPLRALRSRAFNCKDRQEERRKERKELLLKQFRARREICFLNNNYAPAAC